MNSVLLQENSVQTATEELETFQVPVTVNADGTFVPDTTHESYKVEAKSIQLVGSGSPREFVLTFTLSSEAVQAGYKFCRPALEFFIKESSKTAGFRVSPSSDRLSVTVSAFNTKKKDDGLSFDEFSVLIKPPGTEEPFSHDPSILWEPPMT